MEGRVDTAACLRAALSGLAAYGDRLGAVVLSGDLVNDGRDEQYAHLAELLAPALEDLACPIVPVMGNHGLWAALLISFIARGVTLGLAYPKLEAEADAPA